MSSNKDKEAQFCVFSPSEILNRIKNIKKSRRSEVKRHSMFFRDTVYKNDVKHIWKEFRTRIIRGAVTAAVAVSVCVAVNQLGWNFGYEVYVDGENIGMVTDKNTVFDAIEEARTEVRAQLGEDKAYEKSPVFSGRLVTDGQIASVDALKSALLSNVDALTEGCVVYVDGTPVFGVQDGETAEWVLEQYRNTAAGEVSDGVTVDFCEKIEIKKEYMAAGKVKSPENALEIISGTNKVISTYTVQANDTVWRIAEKFDTSAEAILSMNEDAAKGLSVGMELKVEENVPILSVKYTETVATTEAVPYEVEKIEDSSLYEGRTVVQQKGQEGSRKILAKVTTAGGVEIDKEVIASEILTEPVPQIEKVGTKERPATTGSGTFSNPTVGTLSSRYGMRWDRSHNGIDICGAHNSDIKAADGGIVTYAGWMDGYGNYVIIDHENGYQTAYAHCNSIDVSVDDRVTKGEVIAKMGSTGRSTGTHLHFEVKKDGVFVNPLEYVGY